MLNVSTSEEYSQAQRGSQGIWGRGFSETGGNKSNTRYIVSNVAEMLIVILLFIFGCPQLEW